MTERHKEMIENSKGEKTQVYPETSAYAIFDLKKYIEENFGIKPIKEDK